MDLFREQAKRIYKEKTKDIPKKNRLPFAEFYRQLKAQKRLWHTKQQLQSLPQETQEDFDFSDMVNMNDLSEKVVDVPFEEIKPKESDGK